MTMQEKESIIHAMCDVIVRTIHPLRVILFGSYATKTATVFSDADFLVIEEMPFGHQRSRRKETAKILRALLSFDMAKDVLVYSAEEVQKAKSNPLHVVAQAMKTGKVLYDRV